MVVFASPQKTRFFSKDLKQFWEMERATKWFQEHPILSETWSKIQFRSSVSRDFLSLILIQKTYTKDPRTKLSNCIPMRLYGDGAEAQRNLGKSMGDIMSRTFKHMLCYIHADFSNAEANKSSKYSQCNFLHLPVQPRCKIGSCAIAACRNESVDIAVAHPGYVMLAFHHWDVEVCSHQHKLQQECCPGKSSSSSCLEFRSFE